MPRRRAAASNLLAKQLGHTENFQESKQTEGEDGPALKQSIKGRGRGRPRHPRPDVLVPAEETRMPDSSRSLDSRDATDDEYRPTGSASGEETDLKERKKVTRHKDGSKSNVTCEICGKFFKFRATLKQHEQIHYGIKEFECHVCHTRFLHKGTLKVHLRLHTGEMPYKCPHCPKRFRGQTALDCHVFRHTKQGTKCPQCSSIFATPSIVKQHIREVHTTERSHTCQICGVTYKHRKSLRLHLRNHQKRICPDCGKVFHSIYAMMTHRKIHAQDHFQFKCTYCDRKFEKDEELQSHNKLRWRAYQCEMCCHSFNKAEYLTNHNRRNHWKEMGLEQLKVAPPKNGWNRKGVPKPKKVEGQKIHSSAEITESMVYDRPPETQQAIYNSMENNQSMSVPMMQSMESFGTESYHTEIAEPGVLERSSTITTITTEIRPISPKYPADIKSCDEFPGNDGIVETLEEQESDFEYECAANDDVGVAEESDSDQSLIGRIKVEESTLPEASEPTPLKVEFPDQDDLEQPSVIEATVTKVEVLEDFQKKEPVSDSEDEVPLVNFLPKGRTSRHVSQPLSKTSNKSTKRKTRKADGLSSNGESLPIKREPIDGTDDNLNSTEKEGKERKRRMRLEIENDSHKRTKIKQELYCPYCGESFRGRTALKQHKAKVHPDMKPNKGPFICEICGKSYATVASMVVHRGSHVEYQRFKCDECPKAFTYRCYLENHKRAEHLHERLICPLCGKQFKYSQDLKVHTKQHEDDKPFKCDLCPSVFRYPSALRCHKALHVETIFTCDICQKEFKYANSLRVHKRLHTGVKRFRCEICDREFHTKAPLVRHLATHSVEREMKCVVCDKIFYKKIELVIHQTKEHPNNPVIGKTIKIHVCPVCGQEFTKKSNLKSHSYIHGDVYKYKCDLCEDQKFKQHAGLRHHLTHFHKLEIRKRQPKDEGKEGQTNEEVGSTINATLAPAVSVLHNGVEFMVQRIECE
ncbi:zinc finger protein 62 homolog [Topomyia yanbarensis]|uniref:zinc finger protein 62 homolog n=1 Tax=Topomyia yanbarensis TaxID=2498891 RepID=UPI00273AD8E0|nr:zinc finger protein 62 homolog [Topomyia yanbarensis]